MESWCKFLQSIAQSKTLYLCGCGQTMHRMQNRSANIYASILIVWRLNSAQLFLSWIFYVLFVLPYSIIFFLFRRKTSRKPSMFLWKKCLFIRWKLFDLISFSRRGKRSNRINNVAHVLPRMCGDTFLTCRKKTKVLFSLLFPICSLVALNER